MVEYTLKVIKTVSRNHNIEYLLKKKKNPLSSLQMVATDLFIPSLTSGMSFWIWSSIRKKLRFFSCCQYRKTNQNFFTKLFYEYHTILCSQMFISSMHNMVKRTLKIFQCLHYKIIKSMVNHFFNVLHNFFLEVRLV